MEIRRIALILIIIFLSLTVLFYSLYRKEAVNKTLLTEEFVAGAVQNLKSSGVAVSADDIERTIPEKDIYVFEVPTVNAHHEKITQAISKVVFGGNATTASFDTPEGISVGIYDSENESKELGRVVFSDATLTFNFSKKGVNVSGASSAILNNDINIITETHRSVIESILQELSYDNAAFRYAGASSNEEYVIITAMQEIGGHDIHDVYINFIFHGDEVIDISGKWIVEKVSAEYHNQLVDGVNVLYRLDLENISSIKNERLVYFLRKSDNNRYFIIPGWEITYTDKTGKLLTAYFNAL